MGLEYVREHGRADHHNGACAIEKVGTLAISATDRWKCPQCLPYSLDSVHSHGNADALSLCSDYTSHY
jgi:hypothetical protein